MNDDLQLTSKERGSSQHEDERECGRAHYQFLIRSEPADTN